jgi:Big-like domain-containing protein/HYR domain-containing protein/K319-like protein
VNLESFVSVRVLSLAFIFVALINISSLVFVFAESVTPAVPTTKSISDTEPFLREIADTTPPIDTKPPVVTVPHDMIVEATGPEGRIVSYESSATDTVDGNLATVCNPKSGSLFALGQTRVECTAVDKAGNTGKNQFIITVRDTTPPETKLGEVTVGWLGSITSGDTTPSVDTNFDFSGTDLVGISHYECRIDGGGWKSAHTVTDINSEKINTCTYTGVRDPGTHNFEVRAVDTSGNKDGSPARFMWNIQAPDEAIQGLITRVNSIYQSLNLDSALHQAVEDLSDNSVSNDANSCYLLNSFMNDLKVQNMIGTISLTDLNDFVKTTLAIMDNIGCLPPIANAGSPQTVQAGETGVMLDGTDSIHADNPTSFKWKQIGGSPTVEIRNSAKAKASFDAPTYDQFKNSGTSTTLSFELTVSGAGDLKSTAITTVKVNAEPTPPPAPSENTPPVAKAQSVTTNRDTAVPINLDATDKDGDSLTYSLTSSPSHGSLSSFDKDTGEVVYTPKSGYTGNDGFTFTANDKSSTSNSAKVSISVNPVKSNVTTPEKEKEKENQNTIPSNTALPNNSALPNTTTLPSNSALPNNTISNTTGGSTKMHLEEATKALEEGNKDVTSTQLAAAQQAISEESEQAKMHLEEATKALEEGNKDVTSTQLAAAQQAISEKYEQAKMHLDEAMKAFSAGDTNGTLTDLKAANQALE